MATNYNNSSSTLPCTVYCSALHIIYCTAFTCTWHKQQEFAHCATQTNTRSMQCISKFYILKRFGAGMHLLLLFAFYFTFALFSPISFFFKSFLLVQAKWMVFLSIFCCFNYLFNFSILFETFPSRAEQKSDWDLSLLPRRRMDNEVHKT